MAIKIIDSQPDIYITRSEYDRLKNEWNKCCQFMVDPPSLEEWIERNRKLPKEN
jgi:hypothetical protein